MTTPSRILPVLTCLLFSFAAAAQKAPFELREDGRWHENIVQGKKTGYRYSHTTDAEYRGIKCLKTQGYEVSIQRVGNRVSRSVQIMTAYHRGDDSLYRKRISHSHGQVRVVETFHSAKSVRIVKTLDGKSETTSHALSEPVVRGFDGEILRRLGLVVGKVYTRRVFSTESLQVETETARVVAEVKYRYNGKLVRAFRVDATRSDMKGLTMQITVGPDGTEYEASLPAAGFILRKCTKAQALERPSVLAERTRLLRTNLHLKDNSIVQAMTLQVTGEKLGGTLRSNDYQQVRQIADDRIEILLKQVRFPQYKPLKLPLASPDDPSHLAPSLEVQSDAPAIQRLARQILAGERDAYKAAQKLCRWVYENLEKVSSLTASKSALQTLKERSGDCTEHAVLFTALARAAGLPARMSVGMVFLDGAFGFHQWCEVYVGKWLPVDPTVDYVSIPACFVRFGFADEKKPAIQTVITTLRFYGGAKIHVTGYQAKGAWVPEAKFPPPPGQGIESVALRYFRLSNAADFPAMKPLFSERLITRSGGIDKLLRVFSENREVFGKFASYELIERRPATAKGFAGAFNLIYRIDTEHARGRMVFGVGKKDGRWQLIGVVPGPLEFKESAYGDYRTVARKYVAHIDAGEEAKMLALTASGKPEAFAPVFKDKALMGAREKVTFVKATPIRTRLGNGFGVQFRVLHPLIDAVLQVNVVKQGGTPRVIGQQYARLGLRTEAQVASRKAVEAFCRLTFSGKLDEAYALYIASSEYRPKRADFDKRATDATTRYGAYRSLAVVKQKRLITTDQGIGNRLQLKLTFAKGTVTFDAMLFKKKAGWRIFLFRPGS